MVLNKIIQIFSICISIQIIIISCDLYHDPVPSHSIQISRPNEDTEVKVGEYLTIRWESRDVSDYIRLDLYNNGLYAQDIDSNAPNNFEYSWYPSDDIKHSENYQIKITDILDSNVFAFSAEFLIYKSVTFTDNNLNTVIRNMLGNSDEITTKDLVKITGLDARDKNIWST